MRNCRTCLELFQAKSYSKQKYCSRSCFGKINGKENKNLKHKHKEKSVIKCKGCNKIGIKKVFCSVVCDARFKHFLGYVSWLLNLTAHQPTGQTLYKYLLSLNINKCSICGIKDWNNKKIRFDVDHINGDHTNNRPENLRLICQNCHAQTDTYKGKNRGNGRHFRKLRYQEGKSF